MKTTSSIAIVVIIALTTGCSFENSSKLFSPTAPTNTGGATGSAGTGQTSGTGASASAFAGSWGSSTIAGLPLGTCSDVKWLITTQTDTTLAGNVTATCDNGISVAANLSGTLAGVDRMNLTATGTLTAMGLPCPFTLSGSGVRGAGDTMRVDYTGNYCLGNLSGTEHLRRFPS